MHKVMFWDKSEVFVEDDKVAAIERLMGTQRKARLVHLANPAGDVVMGTAIYRVTPAAYRDYEHLLPKNDKMIAAPKPPEITEEQRAKNIERLAQLKKDFKAGKFKPSNRRKEKSNGEQETV